MFRRRYCLAVAELKQLVNLNVGRDTTYESKQALNLAVNTTYMPH